ncbi:MAG: cobalamin-dependent protein [Acidimicrobiia bacterium]
MCHDDELNLKQVARELGVHYMTAYRYVRSGRLAATRQGNVWMVRRAELAAFAGVPLAAHGDAGRGEPVDWVARLRDRFVVGDDVGAWATVEAALVSGWTPEEVIVDLVGPAVATTSVDDGPAAGHLAVTAAQRTITLLGSRFRRRGRSRGTVVLGSPSGESHGFGLAVIAELIRLRNYSVRDLGIAAPAEAFADAATAADRLVAVAVGVTSVDNLESARRIVTGLRDALPGVPVFVGGQAVRNAEIASVAGATGWAADVHELVTLIEALRPRPRRRQTSAPTPA